MAPQAFSRRSYDGVVACQPVTIPCRRYSTESAAWWIGRALHELTKQLTGKVLDEQVVDARIGLVSGFGMINYDRGLSSSASLLARSA
jgi:hypothetical protein